MNHAETTKPAVGWRGRAFSLVARHPIALGLLFIVGGNALLLGSACLWLALSLWHAEHAQTIVMSATHPVPDVSRLGELRREVAAAAGDLARARQALDPYGLLVSYGRRVPVLRGPTELFDVLDMGVDLSAAGDAVVSSLEPLHDHPSPDWATVGTVLAGQRARLVAANARLAAVAATRSRINRGDFVGMLAPIGARLDQIDRVLPTARAATAALALLPSLVGADHPVNLLLIAQNEEERRATGGFIGSMGVARLSGGKVVRLDVRSSYDFSSADRPPLPPPAPLATWMGFGGWYIRDANWFADFPTSAAWLQWFWTYYYGEQIDGVIAFDEETISQFLAFVGPVHVPSYNETITAENYRARMLYWLYLAGSPTENPRFVAGAKTPFVGAVASELRRRLLAKGPSDLVRLAPVLQRLLVEKHLLLFLDDAGDARTLAQVNWDGHVDQSATDFLLASDSTITYTKLAPYVKKSVGEEIAIGPDGSAEVTVSLDYANTYVPGATESSYPTRYLGDFWNPARKALDFRLGYYAAYVRLYVPASATLVDATGGSATLDDYPESGRHVFATVVTLPAGTQKELRLRYALPGGTWQRAIPHPLLVQKEPGTDSQPFRLQVDASPGYVVRTENGRSGAGLVWTTVLQTDHSFVAVWQLPADPDILP